MKKQVKFATGAAAVLLIGLIGSCAWFLSGVGSAEYYAQIDNNKVEQVEAKGGVISFKGNLPYAYTLLCYDENGGAMESGLSDGLPQKKYSISSLTAGFFCATLKKTVYPTTALG